MRTIATFALPFVLLFALAPLAGCPAEPEGDDTADTAATDDTADADTGDSDTGEPTDTADTADTGEPAEAAPCPGFAPFDVGGAWWTYDAQGVPMTFTATGATTWNGLTAYGQVLDFSDWGMTMTVWYTCEADGVHQAGMDVVMSGETTTVFLDPQPLLMPAEPQDGFTWTAEYVAYEETSGGGGTFFAQEGTPGSFRGTIAGVETVELDAGTFETWVLEFEQDGETDRMWWADGVGWVLQGVDPEARVELRDYSVAL